MTAPAVEMESPPSRDPLEVLASELQGPTSDAQLDALASELCRMLGEIRDEITRYSQAREMEEARLAFRYQALLEPLEQRYARIEEIGKEVASRADFGKKKSRKVGNGVYGRRQVAESVKVADQEVAVLWLDENAQGSAVREKTVRSVEVKEAKPIVLGHLLTTGEVAPGFEHSEAHDVSFVEPA